MSRFDIVGADVVEVAPAYDHADITSIAAAHVACDLLCLWRQRKVGPTSA
jgi:agmatinase